MSELLFSVFRLVFQLIEWNGFTYVATQVYVYRNHIRLDNGSTSKDGFMDYNRAGDTQKYLRLFDQWKDKKNAMCPNNPVSQDFIQAGK